MRKIKNKVTYINITITIITIAISLFLGIIFDDYIWGPLTLTFGFLNSYYMAIGKWQNYIYGILFTLTYSYICTINGLYGWIIFSLLIYLPVQIYGLINWFKNKTDSTVNMKSFTIKNSIIICLLIILGSTALGFLLSLIQTKT